MVTLLAIKAFLQFWGVKALAFIETVPYKRYILLGVVVLLVFLGAVRYCSRPNQPDYTIQSGTEEIQRNEDRRKGELEQKLEKIDSEREAQKSRIDELEKIVQDLERRRGRNTTAEELEKKANRK